MEVTSIFVRLQKLPEYDQKLIQLSEQDWILSMLCVEHNGELADPNPHWHFTAHTAPLKLPTIRARLRVLFNKGTGNGHMSLKAWDGNIAANSYMFHERPDATPFINKNYTQDQLDDIRHYNEHIQETRIRKPTLTNILISKITQQYTEQQTVYTLTQAVEDMIIFSIERNRLVPTPMKMAQTYQTALLTVTREQDPRRYQNILYNIITDVERHTYLH